MSVKYREMRAVWLLSMLTFLFWNLKSQNVGVLASLVRQHYVDVLVLAECPMLPARVLKALNEPTADYYLAPTDCHKLQLYVRFPEEFVLPVLQKEKVIDGADFTFRRLVLPGRDELLLCAVHFPSKLRQQPIDQTMFATQFARILAEAEKAAGHGRTILMGDLNMNPYEDGVVTTAGLHAVMTRRIALRESRRFKSESYRYFYNPMWSHFGEKKQGHAGTYYYGSPKGRADFWNIYDQVMVRPDLLPHFRDDEVEILWQDLAANVPLVRDDGRPNDKGISDHLPLLFKLHL